MAVTMKLEAKGQVASGSLIPSAGASIEITPAEGKALSLSLNYQSPDQIVLTAAGTMSIAHTGLGLSAGVDLNLVDGKTQVTGAVSFAISKDVSAVISGQLGPGGPGASGALTIRFG